jgi:hypothetical protein
VAYLEAVVVCVNYSDFLAHTLPANRNQFNRMVVVTTPLDTATQRLCEHYDVECVQTDVFTENGEAFAKGRGINAGLQRLSRKGWVVHMDADILLPPKTRGILDRLPLDPQKVYGADRLMCPSAQSFAAYLDAPPPVQEAWVFVHLNVFPMGVRLAQYMEPGGGYVPIGYWQLWHPGTSGVHTYPETHGTAARTDFQHALKWPRERRELLPELVLIHLESQPGMALNWNGRTTPPFSIAAPAAVPAVPTERRGYRPRHLLALLRRLWRVMRRAIRGLTPGTCLPPDRSVLR